MSAIRWIVVLIAVYEIFVGAAELSTLVSSNALANTVVGWPSVGNVLEIQASLLSSPAQAGGVDVGVGLVLFVLAFGWRI